MNLRADLGETDGQRANRLLAEGWIDAAVRGDAALGRSSKNFVDEPEKVLRKRVRDFNARGVRLYSGSGNIFVVDVTRERPRIVQRRPLAQRFVELEVK